MPLSSKNKKKRLTYSVNWGPHIGAPPHISSEIGVHYNSVHQNVTYIFADMTPILCFWAIIPLSSKKTKQSLTYSVNWENPSYWSPTHIYRPKPVFTIVFTNTIHTFLLIWHLFMFFWGIIPLSSKKQKKSLTYSVNWGIPSYWSPTPYIVRNWCSL